MHRLHQGISNTIVSSATPRSAGLQPTMQHAALRGVADETTVYEIP